METYEQVLGRVKANMKEWISKETWQIIEQRKVAKKTPQTWPERETRRDRQVQDIKS